MNKKQLEEQYEEFRLANLELVRSNNKLKYINYNMEIKLYNTRELYRIYLAITIISLLYIIIISLTS